MEILLIITGILASAWVISTQEDDTQDDIRIRGRAREIEHLVRGREYRLWLE